MKVKNPTKQPQKPLKLTDVPDYPWQRVGTDMFIIQGRHYLIMVDHCSNFIEVDY